MNASELNSLSQLLQGLEAAKLAARLGISTVILTQHRQQPDFEQWSQQSDPEGVSWRYDEKSQRYRVNLSFGR